MKSEILKLEEDLRQAMLKNDVEKLNQLIDDSLVFVGPDGNIATKQMDLDAHKNNIQTMTEMIPREQSMQQIKDDFVVVTVKMEIAGTYANFDISGSYRYLRIWKKINDSWKIVAGSVVKISD